MITLTNHKISDRCHLSYIHTEKFKTGSISFYLSAPKTKRNSLLNMVLAGVLNRGCVKYPSLEKINLRLDELYDTNLSIQNAPLADTLSVLIGADFINNNFSIDGINIFDGTVELMANILKEPIFENGCFPEQTVEKEKRLIRDSLEAEINNTRSFATGRVKELLNRNNDEYPTLKYYLDNIDTVSASELTE